MHHEERGRAAASPQAAGGQLRLVGTWQVLQQPASVRRRARAPCRRAGGAGERGLGPREPAAGPHLSRAKPRRPGPAGVAARTATGRLRGAPKPNNQDTFLVEAVGAASFLAVLDGHGADGHVASRLVARHMAAAVQREAALASSGGSSSSLSWDYDPMPGGSNLRSPAALAAEAAPFEFDLAAAQTVLERTFSAVADAVEAAVGSGAKGCDLSRSGTTCVAAMVLEDRCAALHAALHLCAGGGAGWQGGGEPYPSCSWAARCARQAGVTSRRALTDQIARPRPSPHAAPARSIVTAHCGDSRAVLGTYDEAAGSYTTAQLTADHKPSALPEMARVLAAGGKVTRTSHDKKGNPTGQRGGAEGRQSPAGTFGAATFGAGHANSGLPKLGLQEQLLGALAACEGAATCQPRPPLCAALPTRAPPLLQAPSA